MNGRSMWFVVNIVVHFADFTRTTTIAAITTTTAVSSFTATASTTGVGAPLVGLLGNDCVGGYSPVTAHRFKIPTDGITMIPAGT